MRRPLRFVQVQNIMYINQETSHEREFNVQDTDLVIYDTIEYPYYIFEGRLWLYTNFDKTETLPMRGYKCLGTVMKEYDKLEVTT